MVRVRIEREGCVSCTACWTTCPDVFEENPEDTKSQITERYRVKGDPALGDVEDDQIDCVIESADLCPTQVIHVED
jgi:ferredoxin